MQQMEMSCDQKQNWKLICMMSSVWNKCGSFSAITYTRHLNLIWFTAQETDLQSIQSCSVLDVFSLQDIALPSHKIWSQLA